MHNVLQVYIGSLQAANYCPAKGSKRPFAFVREGNCNDVRCTFAWCTRAGSSTDQTVALLLRPKQEYAINTVPRGKPRRGIRIHRISFEPPKTA